MAKSRRRIFIVVWMSVVLAGYIPYAGMRSGARMQWIQWDDLHISAEMAARATQILPRWPITFAATTMYAVVALGTGYALLRLLAPRTSQERPPLMVAATSFLFGQALLATVFLGLGFFNILTPLTVAVVIIFTGLISGYPLVTDLISRIGQTVSHIWVTLRQERGWGSVGILASGVFLLTSLQSFSILSYDAANFYMADGYLSAEAGSVVFAQYRVFAISMFHAEIQYAALIQTVGYYAARHLTWFIALAAIVLTIELGRELGLRPGGQTALGVMVVTTTALTDLVGDGKIDLWQTAAGVGALLWFILALRERRTPAAVITGLLAGLAVAYKLILGPPLVVLFAAVLVHHTLTSEMRLSDAMRLCIPIGVTALVPVALFMAKNALFIGEPFAPVYGDLSGLGSFPDNWAYGDQDRWMARLGFPFYQTFVSRPESLGSITPLALGLLPAALLLKLRWCVWRVPLIATGVLVGWLYLGSTPIEIRYVLPIWLIAYIALATPMATMLRRRDVVGRFARVSVLLICAVIGFRTVMVTLQTADISSQEVASSCLNHYMCSFLDAVNTEIEPNARPMIMSPYPHYYESYTASCRPTAADYIGIRNFEDEQVAFWTHLYDEGFSYLTYDPYFASRQIGLRLIPDPDAAPPGLTVETLYEDEAGFRLMRITADGEPVPTPCATGAERRP